VEENSNDFTIGIYEEKENLNVNESIPNKNKVTANDMNQIRNNLLNAVYLGTCTDEELQQAIENLTESNVLKDYLGNILDFKIPRYEKTIEKSMWKKQIVNLANNQTATVPGIKDAQEIYIKANYNADSGNYAIMTIVNDGTNGYYSMEAYYWQGAYPISVSINWQNGTIRNCTDKSNIVLIAYR